MVMPANFFEAIMIYCCMYCSCLFYHHVSGSGNNMLIHLFASQSTEAAVVVECRSKPEPSECTEISVCMFTAQSDISSYNEASMKLLILSLFLFAWKWWFSQIPWKSVALIVIFLNLTVLLIDLTMLLVRNVIKYFKSCWSNLDWVIVAK